MKDNGNSAFPSLNPHQAGASLWYHNGMSLRDYFAAKVLQSLIGKAYPVYDFEYISTQAYIAADAMLKAREE